MKKIIRRIIHPAGAVAALLLVPPFIRICLSQSHGRRGDGGSAIQTMIDGPSNLTFDAAGNLFVYEESDDLPPAIREIAAGTRKITTLTLGCDQNSWPPKKGDCLGPVSELLVQDDERLLVAEFTKRRLRSFDIRTKKLSPVAGNGTNEFSGDGGPAVSAGIKYERCAATDRLGNIFVCDWNRIRRIDARTKTISTIAGTGEAGFGGDGGSALEAQFDFLASIALNSVGDLFITDGTSGRIRRVDSKTGIIETIAGTGRGGRFGGFEVVNGPALQADLHDPRNLAVDREGNLLFVNEGKRVCKIDLRSGVLSTIAGRGQPGFKGDGGPATQADIEISGLALDPKGNLFLADWEHNRIRRVDAVTGIISTFAGNGLPLRGPHPPIL